MIKRILTTSICLMLLCALSTPVYAQMSDDAVVAYVKEGMASGKSQNELVKELAARGVTRAQAERLKKRFEDGEFESSATTSKSKSKSKKNMNEREQLRHLNTSNQQLIDEELEEDSLLSEEEEFERFQYEKLKKKYGEVKDTIKKVFGRNIFTNKNLTFAPSMNIPTPANYKLGPGDEVVIEVWGTNQASIRQTISPEGTINVEDIGVVNLNGMTVKEANVHMRRMLDRIYSVYGDDAASDIKLTLGDIRTIQVNLVGEVATPGTYYLPSLSNIYHALYRGGGVSDLGSLREIQLIRNGKKVATIDIYDFILKGKTFEDVILQEGDIVLVPAYKSLVDIAGKIKRPMLYEMKEGESVSDLLSYAGGFVGDSYRNNLNLIRRNGREYQVYTVRDTQYPSFTLMDGDSITVGEMLKRYENRVEIKGAVYRPGVYELGGDIQTVKELVTIAEGLMGDAFTNRALLQREKEDFTLETQALDIAGILNGTISDIPLRKNDILYIPSIHDLNDMGYFEVFGEVANPGDFVFAHNTTIEDAIIQAGGLLESASTVKVDVSRRVKNPAGVIETDTVGYLYTFKLKDGFVIDGDPNFVLEPYDQIFVRRSPGYQEQRHVYIHGRVLFAGNYALSSTNERLSELIRKAGGVSKDAYIRGTRLSRIITREDRMRMEATIDILNNTKDSIDISKFDMGDRYYVGINLEEVLANPGGEADIVLQEGDVVYIPEYQNTVKVSGNVLYPNTVTYKEGMRVKDYIAMAGGYGFEAKKSRAFIVYMNGTVAKAKKNSRKIVEPGCEIIIPQKRKQEGKLQEILSIATTSASIATMVASITNIIRN